MLTGNHVQICPKWGTMHHPCSYSNVTHRYTRLKTAVHGLSRGCRPCELMTAGFLLFLCETYPFRGQRSSEGYGKLAYTCPFTRCFVPVVPWRFNSRLPNSWRYSKHLDPTGVNSFLHIHPPIASYQSRAPQRDRFVTLPIITEWLQRILRSRQHRH